MKNNEPLDAEKQSNWDCVTWDGARREQLRRWAELPLEQAILAVEEMQEMAENLGMERFPQLLDSKDKVGY